MFLERGYFSLECLDFFVKLTSLMNIIRPVFVLSGILYEVKRSRDGNSPVLIPIYVGRDRVYFPPFLVSLRSAYEAPIDVLICVIFLRDFTMLNSLHIDDFEFHAILLLLPVFLLIPLKHVLDSLVSIFNLVINIKDL